MPAVPFDFDINSLQSEALGRLYREVVSFEEEIRIEIVPGRRDRGLRERNPASTVGLEVGRPTIRLSDSLGRDERIEAIAHECLHLLLFYGHGLGVIGLKPPRHRGSDELFKFCLNLNKHWDYLLGQTMNTVHHLILIDYLKNEYGIESDLHRHLLQHNFRTIAKDNSRDKESLYARGLIAFEYERLIGKIDSVMDSFGQPELFWKAYHSSNKHFGNYRFPNIPTPSVHEENILSFLEELGYQKEDFMFFP